MRVDFRFNHLVDKSRVMVYQAVLTKVLPLIFAIPALLIISPFTKSMPILSGLDPTNILYGFLLLYMGLIFLIEMGFALPDSSKSNAGKFGAGLLFSLAIGSFLYGGGILGGFYDPLTNVTELNTALQILFLIAIIMFFFQAREEIFHFRRFRMHVALRA